MNTFPTQHLDPMRNIRPQSSNGADRGEAAFARRNRERDKCAGERAVPPGAVSTQGTLWFPSEPSRRAGSGRSASDTSLSVL